MLSDIVSCTKSNPLSLIMLPYWQENLRVQIFRNYKDKYEKTAEALSQCWANKWFLGCEYPRGVHAIIDKWPAPRKEDVNRSIKLPAYNKLDHLQKDSNHRQKQSEVIRSDESENEDIDVRLRNNHLFTGNNSKKRSLSEAMDDCDVNNEDYQIRKKMKSVRSENDNNDIMNQIISSNARTDTAPSISTKTKKKKKLRRCKWG